MNADTNYADFFFLNTANDIDTLEKNVKEFPFSSVARFLLLYHYKKNNNPAFENLAKKTGIYINNPLWINYQLAKIDDDAFSMEDPLQSKKLNENAEENTPVAVEEPGLPAGREITQILVSENEVANENEVKNNFSEEEKQNGNAEENIPVAVEEEINQIPVSGNEVANESGIKNNFSEEEKRNENAEENIPVAVEEEINQIPVSENETTNESEIKNIFFEEEKQNGNAEENIPVAVEEQITQIPVSENETTNKSEIKNIFFEEEKQNGNAEENIPISVEEQINQIPVSENETINENEIKNILFEEEKQNGNAEENIPVAVEEPGLPAGREITQIPVSENEAFDESEIKNNFSEEEEKQNEKTEDSIPVALEEEIMQIPVSENYSTESEIKEDDSASEGFESEIKTPENNEEDLIPFEPLHTVDYFASQGIKISEEALENDHLGKQVKSFTAWLKSMKKLHPGQLPEQNEVIEKIIQANAEVSNQNANVLTEAMAEVLIKQNKKEKAIEMYQKLSLINPSKSAYFASKIESLKII